jgi:SHS family sialic acid transporter-like MFS transporter
MISPATGRWLALIAAYLGWLFDGFEMGIFGVVGRSALRSLLPPDQLGDVDLWFGIITALFLIGAAAGGVLFGWLGDRIGRVRAMALSVLTYAALTGGCGLAQTPLQLAMLRFFAALGMGGEWALGVALVMEVWNTTGVSKLPGVTVRAWLAGIIGSASNLGFALVALLSIGLSTVLADLRGVLEALQLPDWLVQTLLANQGWRLLMLLGITPAILTFLIRLFVPESEKWTEEKATGRTDHWASRDLLGVLFGTAVAVGIAFLWMPNVTLDYWIRISGTLLGLIVTGVAFLYPVKGYLQRAGVTGGQRSFLLKRMLLAALLSGVPLIGTWASIQWGVLWVSGESMNPKVVTPQGISLTYPTAMGWTQFWSALGSVFGCILAAWSGDWIGRRPAYFCICVLALVSTLGFYQLNTSYNTTFLVWAFFCGFFAASFYGWIPLYFPELFPTSVRAIGQGFGFNFGRILAAIGALQTGVLTRHVFQGSVPTAASVMACVFVVGMVVIWFAPETKGKGLPD